ncbi:hypothetical protein TNCV_2281071 [Trichonephila clavipes]|nr:hypothetical protein TNCV_2281071 [Trichonephila clavipes]
MAGLEKASCEGQGPSWGVVPLRKEGASRSRLDSLISSRESTGLRYHPTYTGLGSRYDCNGTAANKSCAFKIHRFTHALCSPRSMA